MCPSLSRQGIAATATPGSGAHAASKGKGSRGLPLARLVYLGESFPPSFPFKAVFSSLPAIPKKGNNLKVTIFSYLSLRKRGSEFGENVRNFPTIGPFDFCQSNLIT